MIYERPVFIFTTALSVIASCLVGEAVTAEQITVQTDLSSRDSLYSLSSSLTIAQENREQANQIEPLISRRWLGLSIVVTSVIFLLLLWVLFSPDARTRAEAAVLNLSPEKSAADSEDLYLAADDKELSTLFATKEYANLTLNKTVEVLEQRRIHPNPTLDEEPPNMEKKPDSLTISNNIEHKLETIASRATGIDVVFELIHDLNHGDRRLQRKAIWELGRVGDSRSIEPLVAMMSEVDSLDKNLILSAISQIAHRNFQSIHDTLFDALADSKPEVRIDAIRYVTTLHEPTSLVTQRLSILLEDQDKEVRRTARWALHKINSGFYSTPSYAAEFADPKQIVAKPSEKFEKYI